MKNLDKQTIVGIALASIQIVTLILMITFAVMLRHRNITIKQQKNTIKAQTEQIDSLTAVNRALGAEDVLTVNVNFAITQKNVLSFSQTNAQNIAREVSTITRQELYDSLYAIKTKDNGNIQQK